MPGAAVGHPHLDHVAERRGRDRDLASRRRVERGVLEEVREDLIDLHRVDEHVGQIGADREPHTDLGELRSQARDDRLHQLVDGRRLAGGLQRARPDLRQVHQVAHDAG